MRTPRGWRDRRHEAIAAARQGLAKRGLSPRRRAPRAASGRRCSPHLEIDERLRGPEHMPKLVARHQSPGRRAAFSDLEGLSGNRTFRHAGGAPPRWYRARKRRSEHVCVRRVDVHGCLAARGEESIPSTRLMPIRFVAKPWFRSHLPSHKQASAETVAAPVFPVHQCPCVVDAHDHANFRSAQ